MYTEARDNKYPKSELLEALQLTMEEAEKCQMVTQQLCGSTEDRPSKPRTRGSQADAKYRLTAEELQLFANQLETLPAKVGRVLYVGNSLVYEIWVYNKIRITLITKGLIFTFLMD